MALLQELEVWLTPLRQRVARMIARAIIDTVMTDKPIQKVQCKDSGTLRDLMQQYGFTSVPMDGCEGIRVFQQGNAEAGVIIATEDRRYRLQGLAPGEVAIYTYKNGEPDGHRIHFKADGSIELYGGKVVVKSGQIELGKGLMKALATEDFVNTVFSAHLHPTAAPGPPSPPTPIPCPTALTTQVKGS